MIIVVSGGRIAWEFEQRRAYVERCLNECGEAKRERGSIEKGAYKEGWAARASASVISRGWATGWNWRPRQTMVLEREMHSGAGEQEGWVKKENKR